MANFHPGHAGCLKLACLVQADSEIYHSILRIAIQKRHGFLVENYKYWLLTIANTTDFDKQLLQIMHET